MDILICWLQKHWDKLIPIGISTIALIAAAISCNQSRKSNKIAAEALSESKRVNQLNINNYNTLNRPILTVKPVSLQTDNNYFEIDFPNPNTLRLRAPIEIQNTGNTVADNIFLRSASSRLYIGNKKIGDTRTEYETETGSALTPLDLPPKEGITKVIDFEFSIPNGSNIQQLKIDLIREGKIDSNFLFHYYSHLNKDEILPLNVSFLISYRECSILMSKL